MGSTHYMDLLMQNSPWNLIIFMAIPVVLAESIAVSELYILWSRPKVFPALQKFRNICGVLAGAAFICIIVYFIPYVVIPLHKAGEWRTWIDVVAIVSYLASGIPMILIALLNLGVLVRYESPHIKALYHIVFLAAFLVLSHVAMIFGMVDPTIAGWAPAGGQEHLHGASMTPKDPKETMGTATGHEHHHMHHKTTTAPTPASAGDNHHDHGGHAMQHGEDQMNHYSPANGSAQ